jgi:L-ornithine N5-oxygenase
MSPHADVSSGMSNSPPPPSQEAFTPFLASNLPETHPTISQNRSHLHPTPSDSLHDVLCIGFGPASLAIGVALHDALAGTDPSLLDIPGLQGRSPRVTFLEKQTQFAWHAGMLLPGAKMQISFMKDMATMRNPRSEFTFVNYLHQQGRLVEFANLNTFLPARIEYEKYMAWCAAWFEDVVEYGQEVMQVVPEKNGNGHIDTFVVVSRNLRTGEMETRRARHVVIAAGGRANITAPFPAGHERVVHSSRFRYFAVEKMEDREREYRVAVVGNGQSAAEIFDYLHANYANARTRLVIKGGALRPSDDSPLYVYILSSIRSSTDVFEQRQRNLQPLPHKQHIPARSVSAHQRPRARQIHKLRRRASPAPRAHLRNAVPPTPARWQHRRGLAASYTTVSTRD